MLLAERRQVIVDRVRATSRVVVGELSAEFGVSEETIRRDLEWLEQEGIAVRTYGGAVLKHNDQAPPPYATRKNTNVEGKVAIARLLAGMVQNGDSLMVDESSTALFAIRAVRHLKEVTLITNSLNILQEVSGQDSWHIISTGGQLKPDIMALVGPKALSTIQSYHVRYAILSARGVNTQLGIADSSDDVVQVKRAMMAASDHAVLLADHRKFDRAGFVSMGRLEEIDRIITDREPSEEWKKRLKDSNVKLYCRSEQAQS
ncbi:DeoR/GlpR family DNA-binding transcription regulator [Flintibacter muris]|uniref:DeoR/GlpR family DNA-binding transcription regulator n=1 Tax=Flintibacter muris TaxID=2941327 RepID=UPI00204014E3|nr:DeoR/GlpR family DNA-binding transcription regulator [Flintibacter muris]